MATTQKERDRIVKVLAGHPSTDYQSAKRLAERMEAWIGGRRIRAYVSADRIVFTGGAGDHSLALDVSGQERIVAHFLGYLTANGYAEPQAGDVVRFRSESAWRSGGTRIGRVVKRTATRVRVAYTFKHGGEAAPVWLPAWAATVLRRASTAA